MPATGCTGRMPFISVNLERKNFCNGLAIDKYKIRLPFSPLARREAWWRSIECPYTTMQCCRKISWFYGYFVYSITIVIWNSVYLCWLLWPPHRAYVVFPQCSAATYTYNNSIAFTFKAKEHRYLVYWQWELNGELGVGTLKTRIQVYIWWRNLFVPLV